MENIAEKEIIVALFNIEWVFSLSDKTLHRKSRKVE